MRLKKNHLTSLDEAIYRLVTLSKIESIGFVPVVTAVEVVDTSFLIGIEDSSIEIKIFYRILIIKTL